MEPEKSVKHPVIGLLESLMGVVSTTGHELEIGIWLEQCLHKYGYSVERIPIAPGSSRYNVYAYFGSSRQTRILLTSHMDTVSPHIPMRNDGKTIYGRGSSDDLGPLAAQIIAVDELASEKKLDDGDIGLLFVVGEENGGHGMIAANDMGLTWEAVIFSEPTNCKLAKGHKGQVAFNLIADGIACHSGYPELGRSATSALIAVLSEFSKTSWPTSDLLGASTFNIGTLGGGEAHNILAASARALCEVRVTTTLSDVKCTITDIVSRHPEVRLEWVFEYPAAYLEWEIEGFDAEPVSFGTDVPRLKGNHKRVLYGPGSILTAHGPDEHIEISQLIDSVASFKKLILHFLK